MIAWLKIVDTGDFIVLGVMFVSLWFLYKNFLWKIVDTIDKKMSKEDCITLRVGCQEGMAEKRQSAIELSDVRFVSIAEKLDVIHKQLTQMIQRIDSHINGGHK